MRALNVPESGAQPVVSDLPVPQVTDGTVLVRVKSAALNAIDNSLATGAMAAMLPHAYPLVVGRDAAGVVEAVGEGVDHVAVGDEVLGHVLLAPPVQAGTIAEYALFPAAAVTPKPAALDFVTAAALPLAGSAATPPASSRPSGTASPTSRSATRSSVTSCWLRPSRPARSPSTPCCRPPPS